jgi:hypothetical protein
MDEIINEVLASYNSGVLAVNEEIMRTSHVHL